MLKPNYPPIEIADLIEVIRETIAKHRTDGPTASEPEATRIPPSLEKSTGLPRLQLQPEFRPKPDNHYHVKDLLKYHDRQFVQSCYLAILGRPADASEINLALESLHTGDVNKIDLLASLRFSQEGNAKNVQLDGLKVPTFFRRLGRLPVAGYVIRLVIALARLPNMVRDQRQFDAYTLSQNQQTADFVNLISAQLTESQNGIRRVENSLLKQLQQTGRRTTETLEKLLVQQERFQHRTSDLLDELKQQQALLEQQAVRRLDDFQTNLGMQIEADQRRLEEEISQRLLAITQTISEHKRSTAASEMDLREEIGRSKKQYLQTHSDLLTEVKNLSLTLTQLEEQWPGLQVQTSGIWPSGHELDPLYAALEDRFRGNRDEIKERLRCYLPYVNEVINSENSLVVDLGSGRGEWLELLNHEGINARGVDNNSVFIENSRKLGLNVVDEDVLFHLRGLADTSVAAVTGFHLIEHLAVGKLLALFDEVLRVLQPGGVAIFETPNPENVLVGSHFFYFDPTHRHPLPSALVELLLEARGFQRIKVIPLHPWESGRVEGDGDLAERINGLFYGPMDYGILGHKLEA